MTIEEFLEWEAQQPLRYEFDGFQPIAMAGGPPNMRQFSEILLSPWADGCAASHAATMVAISK
jgi:hypothetical protein